MQHMYIYISNLKFSDPQHLLDGNMFSSETSLKIMEYGKDKVLMQCLPSFSGQFQGYSCKDKFRKVQLSAKSYELCGYSLVSRYCYI